MRAANEQSPYSCANTVVAALRVFPIFLLTGGSTVQKRR